MPRIDLTQPLEVHDSGGAQRDRTATVIGTLLDGSFIALISGGNGEGIIFDKNGDYLGCANGSTRQGCALSIRNKPVKPKSYTLEVTAEEMALMRILVGNCVLRGRSHPGPHTSLYKKLDHDKCDTETSIRASQESAVIDADSVEYAAVVRAYS